MTLAELITRARAALASATTARETAQDALAALRERDNLTESDVTNAVAARNAATATEAERQAALDALLAEEAEEARVAALASQVHDSAPRPGGQREASGPVWVRTDTDDRRPAVVARNARWANHEVVAGHAAARAQAEQATVAQFGGMGQFVRALTTSSGSAVVPTVWAGSIIDRARNASQVIQAGAEIVPMNAQTVQIGRLTADPTAAFRTEGSTITASDPTFDNVTLVAKTQSVLVVGSMEWFQDAGNADQLVEEAIAKAIALQLDLTALYGGVTSGSGSINLATPPNPRGVLATLLAVASSAVLGNAATNGTSQTSTTFYNELLDLIYTPQDNNEVPNALIWNSKLARLYAKAYDTTGQPLGLPADVANMRRLVSNQIPSYTQGTLTTATDAFVGDWRQLLIGQRLDLTVQVLTERYAENGQIGIVAHWRGDVALARPRAFAVYRSLKGA
ncbi:phage major capsid protein [Actinoplanes sp. HUAS TT8]|uniref:phage major capsid protein n=1 Tax=Actinoplanes sp. HUAS TT8 TaxID=3447453 RepID=UPI003F529022